MKGLARRLIAGFSAAALLVSAVGSDAFTRSLKRTIYADSVDESGKWGSKDDFDDLEQDTRDSDGNKIYNTNYGLHTDKTVSKAYADGRTFDVDLESWYIGENPADVGMILDASGSMAWTTTNPEPINCTGLGLTPNTFLTDEELKKILDPEKTDNSKISYTGYQYYIYEARPSVSEFVPLGYWDGKLQETSVDPIEELKKTWGDSLIGFYPFTSREDLKIISSSNVINNGSIEIYDKDANKVEKDFSNFLVAYKGLDNGEVDRPALALNKLNDNNNYLMLDQKASRDSDGERFNFTLSFYFTANNFSKLDANAQYSLFCIGGTDSSQNYQITFKNKIINFCKKSSSPQGGNITIAGSDKTDIITFVFKTASDGKQTVEGYLNGSRKINATTGDKISSDDIILGYEVSHNSIRVDDIYLFDTALDDADVKTLYENAKKQKVQITTETIKDRAVGDKDNVLATISEDLAGIDDRAGWYYVNSHQVWEDLTDPEIATGKEFRGNQQDYYEVTVGKEKEKRYYTARNFATVPLTADAGLISEIKKGNNETFTLDTKDNGTSPVKFFIDDAGYLRCFFNNGGRSDEKDITEFGKITKVEPFTTEVRTQCSLVYRKKVEDKAEIKTQTLNNVLNGFIDGVQDSSSKSKISAMRFSNNTLVMQRNAENKEKYEIVPGYEDNLKQLLLLDWVSKDDTNSKYSKNLTGNRDGFEDKTTSYMEIDGGKKLYNYFLTGGTNTWVGLKAFADNLAEPVKDEENNKYLILFTDGRDTLASSEKDAGNVKQIIDSVKPSGSLITESTDLASAWADELKKQGYKIFCVMMASGSISEKMPATSADGITEYKKAVEFLQTIASEDPASTDDEKKYYVYTADSAENLQNAFTSILNEIKKPLTNYTVQDYIDPRFDLVDKSGTVLKLKAGGEITYGAKTKTVSDTEYLEYTPKALSYGGGKDGKAKIYYDSEKDMYYLRWEVDSIGGANSPFNTEDTRAYLNESRADDPTTAEENEEQAGRWFSTITVKAKDDFIGGNAILTNGNEVGMNLVFASKELYDGGTALTGKELRDKLSSLSGTDKSKDRDKDGTETDVGSPAKGFPRVCVNVRLQPIDTKPLHEVIYLGEVVSPTYMLSELENGYMEGSYYLEYLKRYAYRLYPSGTDTPLLKLLNAWLGIEDTTKTEKTFTIPYIYLSEPQYNDNGTLAKVGDKAIVNNNSGTSEQNQKDIVGFLTYTWKRVDSTVADIMEEFVVKDTNRIAYSLELKFTPLPQGEEPTSFKLDEHFITDDNFFTAQGDEFVSATEWKFGTRDDYLQALVNEQHEVGGVTKNVYEWNTKYKPTAGNVQVEKGQNYGDATISEDGNSLVADTTYTKDVVNAGLVLELLVKGEDLDGSTTVKEGSTFTFTATRSYTDELDPLPYKTSDNEMGANANEEKYELTFTIQGDLPTVTDADSIYTIWAELTEIKKDSETLTNGLPIGTYTITANLEGDSQFTVKGTDVKFKNLNADNNRGNFVHTYFPDNVNSVSEEAVKDTDDEEYLIWDAEKDLDLAKENIAQNENKDNTLKFYFGTVPTKTINGKNLSNTKGDSVKDKPETTNDYAKDRLGIIMLSYGSSRLAISKEVTSKDIAVIKEQAVLDNFWNFDITLTFNEEQTDTPTYSLKWLDLTTGSELADDDIPKSEGVSITKLVFNVDPADPKVYTATISIKSNTQVILEQLPNDVSYEVSEVRANQEKDGDFQDRYRYNILVEGDDVDIGENQEYGSSSGKLSPASAVNFINQFPSVMLPSSGGIGVDRYILLGTMLTVASALFLAKLWYDRRKRRATHGS